MSLNLILYAVYSFTLLGCLMIGAFSWKRMQAPLRVFYFLIIIIFTSEIVALTQEMLIGRNTEVYNVTDIVQAVIVLAYFSTYLKRPVTGFLVSIGSILVGTFSIYWLHAEAFINNYFLLWSGLVTIGLSVYLMTFLCFKERTAKLTRLAHFWLAFALLFYWIINLLPFQAFNFLAKFNVAYAFDLNAMQMVSNILTYAIIASTFHYLPKLIQ